MHKLSALRDGNWVEHSFAPVFAQNSQRIIAGVPGGDPVIFEQLVSQLEYPCSLLYVLHTPRGEGQPGRYQSPELQHVQLRSFIARFGSYLRSDARFDLWAYSPSERSTLVWDRHNRLFAYGAVDRFASQLRAMGFSAGGDVAIPAPHSHNYHPHFDADAAGVLQAFDWSRSPLLPEDEQ